MSSLQLYPCGVFAASCSTRLLHDDLAVEHCTHDDADDLIVKSYGELRGANKEKSGTSDTVVLTAKESVTRVSRESDQPYVCHSSDEKYGEDCEMWMQEHVEYMLGDCETPEHEFTCIGKASTHRYSVHVRKRNSAEWHTHHFQCQAGRCTLVRAWTAWTVPLARRDLT